MGCGFWGLCVCVFLFFNFRISKLKRNVTRDSEVTASSAHKSALRFQYPYWAAEPSKEILASLWYFRRLRV